MTVTLNPENSSALRAMQGELSPAAQKRFETWAVNQAVSSYVSSGEFPKKEFVVFAKETLSA